MTRTVHNHTSDDAIFQDIAEILRDVMRDYCVDTEITPLTSFQTDLELESFDIVRFGLALTERYGERINLASYLTNMDFGSVTNLTIGDISRYVASKLSSSE